MNFREALTPNGRTTSQVNWTLAIGTAIAFLGAWSLRPVFLPGPMDVIEAFPNLIDQGLWQNLFVSVSTNTQAIGLSCLVVIPLSYLTVMPIARPLVRALSKLRFLGMTGLVVLFTLAFGGGHGLKLALLTFGMGVFLITSLYDIVESIPREEFDHARTLRMGPWRSVMEVVVLGHMDAVLDAVRQNAAMGLMMLSMVEGLVRVEGGLGAMMLSEDKLVKLAPVFAIQIMFFLLGMGQDYLLALFKRWFCPYAFITLERQ